MGVRNQIAVNIMEKYVDDNGRCVAYKVRLCGCDWRITTISRQKLKERILSGDIVCSDVYFTKDNRMLENKEIPSLRQLAKEDKKNIETIGKVIKAYREALIERIKNDQKSTELAIGHNGSALAQLTYDSDTAKRTVDDVIKIINRDDIILEIIDKIME